MKKFTYINFDESLISKLETNPQTLFIFSDFQLRRIFKERNKTNIFEEKFTGITFDEFKNKIYLADKPVLMEAKRMLTLFSALSNETKKKLKVEGYFEFITLANEFFSYFSLCNKFMKIDFEKLQQWQISKINNYNLMKKEYDIYLEKNNFIPQDFIENKNNINLDYLKNFKKIIFVDVIDFKPLDKFLISKISESFEIEFILQINKNDFDEENLKIKSVTFATENFPKDKIKIYKVEDDLNLGINLINNFGEKIGNDIFTPNLENCILPKIFPKYFSTTKLDVLDDTEIYNFFKIHYELVATLERELNFAMNLATLEKNINSQSFKINYNLTSENIKDFYKIIGEDYIYFEPKLLENEYFLEICENKELYPKLLKIYEDIFKISNFETVEDFFKFYKEEIKLVEICEKEYIDIVERIFEAFTLAHNSEKLLSNNLKKIFSDNISLGIFNLIIKYMNSIELKKINLNNEEKISVIKDINLAKERHERENYFIHINSDNIPGSENDGTMFTEFQKRENNLKTSDLTRLEKKYRFFQSVLTCKNSVIYYTENINNAIFISPFLEELSAKLNLEIKSAEISQVNKIIKKSFTETFENKNNILEKSNIFNPDENNLEKNISEDIPEKKIKIGAYTFEELNNCEYKFFLNNIVGLSHVKLEIAKNFSGKFFGNFIHEYLERISKKFEITAETFGNFKVSEEYLETEFRNIIWQNKYKIPLHTKNYFETVLLELVTKNVKLFYENLFEKLVNIKKFSSEKGKYSKTAFLVENNVEVHLSGRADLNIETDTGKYIYDYKTGKINEVQLDFYSILLYGKEDVATKEIFNPLLSEKSEAQKKIKLTVEEMQNKIKEFLNGNFYSKAEKKSACIYCEYSEICRKELDN